MKSKRFLLLAIIICAGLAVSCQGCRYIADSPSEQTAEATVTLPSGAALLPEELVKKNLIKNMEIGVTGYTHRWAMKVDQEKHCYLDGNDEIWSVPSETYSLKIERRKDGYHVYASTSGETWKPKPDIQYAFLRPAVPIPVAQIH